VTPGRAVAIVVLLGLVAAFAIAVLLGFAPDTSGGPSAGGGGLAGGLGGLLVQPAGPSDLQPATAACAPAGQDVTMPAHGACSYSLATGFLGKRLRLQLVSGLLAQATLTQGPHPSVTDQQTLALGADPHEFIYHENQSALALVCQSTVPCAVRLS
jgi:hypothetical protein